MAAMDQSHTTCWTLIDGAANGTPGAVDQFVDSYAPIIEAYLAARWNGTAMEQFRDDALQEVFVECFKSGGVLTRAGTGAVQSFRGFLSGTVKNIALRFEHRKHGRREVQPGTVFEPRDPKETELRCSRVFDRAWAEAMLREATTRHRERAATMGPDAMRRAEILRLRFQEELSMGEIAERLEMEIRALHNAYEKARRDFMDALGDVVGFHNPGQHVAVSKEVDRILELLR